MNQKIVIGAVLLLLLGGILFWFSQKNTKSSSPAVSQSTSPTPSPAKKVEYSQDYTFVLVGDSMTATLGNSDELRQYLTKYYPDKSFEFLNYGFGSTNILSVEKRLTENTNYGRVFQPILNIDFDVILIESMGNNPLSEFSLEEGLKKQNEALDKIVSLIKAKNPRAALLFVATIAPNSESYGVGQVELTLEKRKEWVAERNAYIKNHMAYAKAHNIPLINIYEKSLKNGDGNLEYLDSANYIHPSPSGVYFISHEIADYIYQNKILDSIKKK